MTRRFSARMKVTLIVALFIAAVSGLSLKALIAPAGERPLAAADDKAHTKNAVESEVITLTPRGFEPAAITRPAGRFILMIENPSGEEVSVQLDAENGSRLGSKHSSREAPDWSELLDLRPGGYVLKAPERPEAVCRITITAR